MQRLIRWGLNNVVVIVIVSLLVLVAGIYTTWQIQVESFPNINVPALGITISQPGYSAEDIEQQEVKPIEDRLAQLKEIDSFTSTSNENNATIMIMYPFGQDMEQAKTKIQAEVDKLKLPEDVDLDVHTISLSSIPVNQLAISYADNKDLQRVLEDDMVPELEKLNGVDHVTLSGGKETSWLVKVDPAKAKRYGLSLQAIQTAIQGSDYSLPVGNVHTADNTIPVRLSGKLASLAELKTLPISAGQAGATGTPNMAQAAPTAELGDIATIESKTTQHQITRFNGKQSLMLQVTKEDTANSPAVSDAVKKVVNKYKQKYDFTTHSILDDGQEVTKSVQSLVHEGLLGALFTVLVIALFLRNIRATIIAIVSLPLSIFATVGLLDQLDYTLNMMTLGGLAVAVGRIVDDSIVVIENIFRWKQQNGKDATVKQLAFYATKEVLRAVTSSTLVTVVVFLPLAFVSGIIGEFFRPFALAVVFSIVCSFLVAFLLIPVLGGKFFRNVSHREKESRLARGFERLLRSSLRHKWVPITLAIVCLVGSLAMIPRLGFSFLPASAASTVQLTVALPANATQTDTDKLAKKIEKYLDSVSEINNSQLSLGMPSQPLLDTAGKENEATFTLTFSADVTNVDSVMQTVERNVGNIAHQTYQTATVNRNETAQGPSTGNNVDFKLYGEDDRALQQAAQQVENLLKADSRLKNVSNNLAEQTPKWNVALNDTGKELGIDVNQLRSVVSSYVQGQSLPDFQIGGTKQTLTISYGDTIDSLDELKDIAVPTMAGTKQLSDIVTISQAKAPVSIQHDQGKKYAQVSAAIKSADTNQVSKTVSDRVHALDLPKGVTLETSGGYVDIIDGFKDLGLAMLVAIGLVFLLMSVTFGGVVTPLVILSTLLFVPIGAIAGLLITGQTLSMSGMIGLLMLVGIVVTNAIVLLDRIETNRYEGMEISEAIVEAAKVRLRPILMTALATIFALLPLALTGDDSQLISKGLAVTVIGGLTTSTLLTLIFVPVFYAIVRKKNKVRDLV